MSVTPARKSGKRSADKTAVRRVANYRERQIAQHGLKRCEVRVLPRDAALMQRLADRLRRQRHACHDNPHVDFVLHTVNAPRPRAITADELLDCLLSPEPVAPWRPHVETLLSEVSVEALHRLVLSGFCSFEDLRRAVRVWGEGGDHERVEWIEEMAGFALARAAAQRPAHSRGASARA